MRTAVMALFLTLLCGCTKYVNENQAANMKSDDDACSIEAQRALEAGGSNSFTQLWEMCMMSKGWRQK